MRMKPRYGRSVLVVVVIMAVVALAVVMARGRSVNTRLRSYQASMKSDLVHLREFEQQYHSENGRYTVDVDTTKVRWSDGVHLVDLQVSADGWAAMVRHTSAPGTCSIEVSAANPGTPACP